MYSTYWSARNPQLFLIFPQVSPINNSGLHSHWDPFTPCLNILNGKFEGEGFCFLDPASDVAHDKHVVYQGALGRWPNF